ncbi:hypothetical protein B0T25DRAFT_176080 [Lasiosphaeria hispida]|uniref:Uncharacterized protein n=1 Tax=Lasiosphaeria hispida TaxID=260671 RepID=A0AAJ0MGT8_9PEZI|nr:hypothetical protein B0T25DRAFT_176080 [Lasiosphaeria hispida]
MPPGWQHQGYPLPPQGAGNDIKGDNGKAPKTERQIAWAVFNVITTSPACLAPGDGLDPMRDLMKLEWLGALSDQAASLIFQRDGGLSDGEWYRDLKFCHKFTQTTFDDEREQLVADTMMENLGYNTLAGRAAAKAQGPLFEAPPKPPHSPPTTYKALQAFRLSSAAAYRKEKAREEAAEYREEEAREDAAGSLVGPESRMDLHNPEPQPGNQLFQPEAQRTPPVSRDDPDIFYRDREPMYHTYLLENEPAQQTNSFQTNPFSRDQVPFDPDDPKPQTAAQQRFWQRAFSLDPFEVGDRDQAENRRFLRGGPKLQTAAQRRFSQQAFSLDPFGVGDGRQVDHSYKIAEGSGPKQQPDDLQSFGIDPRELELKPKDYYAHNMLLNQKNPEMDWESPILPRTTPAANMDPPPKPVKPASLQGRRARPDSPQSSPRASPVTPFLLPQLSSSPILSLGDPASPPPLPSWLLAQPSPIMEDPPSPAPALPSPSPMQLSSPMDESISPRTVPRRLIGILSSPVQEPLDGGLFEFGQAENDHASVLLWPDIRGSHSSSPPQLEAPGAQPKKPAKPQKPGNLRGNRGGKGNTPKKGGRGRQRRNAVS